MATPNPSFTFSSDADLRRQGDRRFAAGVTFWAAAAGILWAGVLQVWAPAITQLQNVRAGNVCRAESYLYDKPHWPMVIVGSSMVTDFDRLSQDGQCLSLFMAGHSAIPSLELVASSVFRPRIVAVELNSLPVPPDDTVVQEVRDSAFRFLKQQILAFRRSYQPASVIMTVCRMWFGQNANERGLNPPSDIFTKLRIKELRSQYETPPDTSELVANVARAVALAERLRGDGVKVVFFELPVPHGLADTPYHRSRRGITFAAVKDAGFEIVRFDDTGITTTDGVHLPYSQSRLVARDLVGRLRSDAGFAPGRSFCCSMIRIICLSGESSLTVARSFLRTMITHIVPLKPR